MTSTPVVLCYAFPTPPVVAFDIFIELARRHEDEFALLDNMAVRDLSEDQRERVQAIMCRGGGGFTQNNIRLGKETIDLLPNLKVICTPSTGVNHIDMKAVTARGIQVGYSPGHISSDSVAEFAFGLLLASARSIVLGERIARTTDMKSRRVSIFLPAWRRRKGSFLILSTLSNCLWGTSKEVVTMPVWRHVSCYCEKCGNSF